MNKEAAQRKYPKVNFIGEYFSIGEGAFIEEGASIGEGVFIGKGAFIEEGASIGEGVFIGKGALIEEGAIIGKGATIEEGVIIGEGAFIGKGATIGEGAIIATVIDKYIANISGKNEIRIGCEIWSVEKWIANGANIAATYNEFRWWEETGKYILTFLISQIKKI